MHEKLLESLPFENVVWGHGWQDAIPVARSAVTVETGEIQRTGTAMTPKAVPDDPSWVRAPRSGRRAFAQAAVLRAVCPVEDGARWEPGRGCVSP